MADQLPVLKFFLRRSCTLGYITKSDTAKLILPSKIDEAKLYSNRGRTLIKSRFPENAAIFKTILHDDLLTFGYLRDYRSQQQLFSIISHDIINTIFEFYLYIYPQMIIIGGAFEIKQVLNNAGYEVKPISSFPSVRSDISLKEEQCV